MRPALLALLCLVPSVALAANDEARRRRIIVPYVRATSDCMARAVIESPGLPEAVKSDTLPDLLKSVASQCADNINAMIALHDRLYGPGTGIVFFQGPYMEDLPRAIRARAQAQIDAKIAEADKTAELKRQADDLRAAEERAELQRRADALKAEQDKHAAEMALQEEERKAEEEKRKSALLIEKQKREAEKAIALDTAKKAAGLLRDKLYECADQNLAKLLKSGEGAEVLASAVMTICHDDLAAATRSIIESYRIEADAAAVNDEQRSMLEGQITKAVKDHLIAAAVEAKAAAAK